MEGLKTRGQKPHAHKGRERAKGIVTALREARLQTTTACESEVRTPPRCSSDAVSSLLDKAPRVVFIVEKGVATYALDYLF